MEKMRNIEDPNNVYPPILLMLKVLFFHLQSSNLEILLK